MKLPYADWLHMNNGQRAQLNFLESLTFLIIGTFISMLAYPVLAFVTCMAIVVGKGLYTLGYVKGGGPKRRAYGALIVFLGMMSLVFTLSLSVYFCLGGKFIEIEGPAVFNAEFEHVSYFRQRSIRPKAWNAE